MQYLWGGVLNPPLAERPWLVFDVESAGLHGAGFAVGWVALVPSANRLYMVFAEEGIAISRTHEPLPEWVCENVLPALPLFTHNTEDEIRSEFWKVWQRWRDKDAFLAADVAWPVEARFLSGCIADDPRNRALSGPYPLVDIASVRLAVGLDPLGEETRLPTELPKHNPLADARQSARLLVEALQRWR